MKAKLARIRKADKKYSALYYPSYLPVGAGLGCLLNVIQVGMSMNMIPVIMNIVASGIPPIFCVLMLLRSPVTFERVFDVLDVETPATLPLWSVVSVV